MEIVGCFFHTFYLLQGLEQAHVGRVLVQSHSTLLCFMCMHTHAHAHALFVFVFMFRALGDKIVNNAQN